MNLQEITPEHSIVPIYRTELTAEEIAEAEANIEQIIADEERIAQQKQIRLSALAKLEALGLTIEEINAITGAS